MEAESHRQQLIRFMATNGAAKVADPLVLQLSGPFPEKMLRTADPFSASPSPIRSLDASDGLFSVSAPRWNLRAPVLGAVPRQHQPFLPQFYRSRSLNNTFFLLAVAAVATHKTRFENLFASTSEELAARGMVTCALFTNSYHDPEAVQNENTPSPLSLSTLGHYGKLRQRVLVTVDSLVPVTMKQGTRSPNDLELMFGQTNFVNDFWLIFLEKCYATYRGGYSFLDSGDAVEVLEHLTGGDPNMVVWNGEELCAQGKQNLWWILQEATSLCEPMIATCKEVGGSSTSSTPAKLASFVQADQDPSQLHVLTEPLEMITEWEAGCVVLQAVEYDDSGELPVHPYDRVRGKRPVGVVHRLVKVRCVYHHDHKIDATKLQWGPNSALWTAPARQALGNPAELQCDDMCLWLTLDEFVAHFSLFVHVSNTEPVEKLTVQTETRSAPSRAELVRYAPRFLLSVKDVVVVEPVALSPYREVDVPVDGDAAAGGGADSPTNHSSPASSPRHVAPSDAGAPAWQFHSIHDLEVPPLELGEESEDEIDASDLNENSQARSPSVSSLDLPNATTKFGAVSLTIRVSVPHTERQKPLSVMLFRVLDPSVPLPSIQTVRDGAYSYSLPLQGRLQLTPAAQDPILAVAIPESFKNIVDMAVTKKAGGVALHPQSAKSVVMQFTVQLAAGYYNILVAPDMLKRTQSELLDMETYVQVTVLAAGPSAERYEFDLHSFPVTH